MIAATSGTLEQASAELYRPAATQIHNMMMAASGANISATYLHNMAPPHQGAVAMSDVALANGAAVAVRAQIEKIKADQQREIAHVQAMLGGNPALPALPRYAIAMTAPRRGRQVTASPSGWEN